MFWQKASKAIPSYPKKFPELRKEYTTLKLNNLTNWSQRLSRNRRLWGHWKMKMKMWEKQLFEWFQVPALINCCVFNLSSTNWDTFYLFKWMVRPNTNETNNKCTGFSRMLLLSNVKNSKNPNRKVKSISLNSPSEQNPQVFGQCFLIKSSWYVQ